MGIPLAVGALQPGVGDDGRATVTRPADEEGVEIPVLDAPAQVGVEEVEAGTRPPVAEQAGLDVLGDERPAEQRVVHQVDLACRQVVGRPEVGVELGRSVLRWPGGRELTVSVIALLWCCGTGSAHRLVGQVRSGKVDTCRSWS